MIEPGIKILLDNNTDVSVLVSGRIYLNFAEENERRARIVLTMTNRNDDHTYQGHAGYVTGTMQVACLAPTYTEAKTLAAAVQAALDDYEGTSDGTLFGYIQCVEQRDIPAAPLLGQAKPTFGVSVDADLLALSGF